MRTFVIVDRRAVTILAIWAVNWDANVRGERRELLDFSIFKRRGRVAAVLGSANYLGFRV